MNRLFSVGVLVVSMVSCGGPNEVRPPDGIGPASASTPTAGEISADDSIATRQSVSGGIGAIAVRGRRAEDSQVVLQSVTVSARQVADHAEVSVEHVFESEADERVEGTFRYPMPDGVIVTGLAMMIDGRMVEGELLERERARQIYQEIVDSMQDPALLEWEHGSVFKMRVFPIEPHERKVVTLRYLAPLRRRGEALSFVQGTHSPDANAKLPELVVEWNGKRVFAERDVAAGRSIEVEARESPDAVFEQQDDGTHTAVRLRPNWSQLAAPAIKPPSNWIVAVDTSRSTLEERKLTLEALKRVLSGMNDNHRFVVVTNDIDSEAQSEGFSVPSPAAVERALQFVAAREPDGATNIESLLLTVSELARRAGDAGMVYIGDTEPSWGEVIPANLVELAKKELGQTPIFPLVIGSAADPELARELAQATTGRAVVARDERDVGAFTRLLHSPRRPLLDVRVSAGDDAVVLPSGPLSIDADESFTVLVKTPAGRALSRLSLTARLGDREQVIEHDVSAIGSPSVARRFGASWVRELERRNKPKEQIVDASLAYGVMSKHTSFLVLESEEAYARYAIARRAQQQADGPRIVGADLQGMDPDGASINLDRIQPGDPEIYVEAPSDAESVEVEFPFGVSKNAVYEPLAKGGRGAWMVRFLVPSTTEEGKYQALAHITFADGRVETRPVQYTVDRSAPELVVKLIRGRRPGEMGVLVTQRGPKADHDLRRVEIQTPDGQVTPLTAIRWAQFRGYVSAEQPTGKLRVVGFDRALNHRTETFVMAPSPETPSLPNLRPLMAQMVAEPVPVDEDSPGRPALERVIDALPGDVAALAQGKRTLFVGTFDQGLFTVDARGDVTRVAHAALNRNVNALAWDETRGALWIATARGLSRCTFESALACKRVGPVDDVHALALLPGGGVVSGGSKLAFVSAGGDVEVSLDKKRGWPFGKVWALAVAEDDTLFVGTTRGLYWAPRAVFTAETPPVAADFHRAAVVSGELEDDWVTAVEARGQRLFVGTYNAGVTSFDWSEAQLSNPKRSAALGYVNPAGIELLDSGRVAVATMEGLRVSGAGGWSTVPTPHEDVTQVLPSSFVEGTYWVATRGGLALWRP